MSRIPRLTALLLIFSSALLSGKGPGNNSSVLSSGKWFKIAVTSDGIYRIDYSTLKQTGLTDPSNPRIFGNNEGQLSFYNNGNFPEDLKELAIYVAAGGDGIFNEGDYLLFYARGTHRWNYDNSKGEYTFLRHNYSDTAFYFITSGTGGKRIVNSVQPSASPVYLSESSDELFCHETESENLIESGREWFQRISSTGITIKPGFSDLITSETIKVEARVAGRSPKTIVFGLYEGSSRKMDLITQGVNMYNTNGTYAAISDSSSDLLPSSSNPEFMMKYDNNGEAGAIGWVDYVHFQARVRNSFTGLTKILQDRLSVGTGKISSFSVSSTVNDAVIWDVTDQYNAENIVYTKESGKLIFKAATDSLRRYVVFLVSAAKATLIKNTPVPNQNLHASPDVDMVIITHPLFRKYAEKIAAIHLQDNGLTSLVTTPGEMYNEFSGGVPDIVAIRNFLRVKYLNQRGGSKPLKYLLLFGDGSIENRTPPPNNPNFIPTYQSVNSTNVVSSFTSDDFYGLLEDGEGEADGTEDIGIGRFPVNDTVQAGIMVAKVRRYLDPRNAGDWRNVICLSSDDEDGNAHMVDAEGLDKVIMENSPQSNVEKIYLDAFRQETTVNGQSYPDVNKAINDRINRGCLIFNYTGHGNETQLAHERVVTTDDIKSWKNGGRLPLIITATCEFSRFDDVEKNLATGEMIPKTSAGELSLLNSEGGAIALMSTTRVVYSAPNFFLNRNIFDCAFDRDSKGNPLTFGDIIRIAKNNSGTGSNKRNFSLLGDPALRLAYPWHGNVITDSVNNSSVSGSADSLKALSLITISGHIEDSGKNIINDFDGIVSPVIFDKPNKIRTLANDGGPVMEFNSGNSIIFSGKTKAANGRFRFTFIVPREINYTYGNGKISYYATDETRDMNGYNDIIVGGFTSSAIKDSSGPDIELFMNDTLFRNGGMTDASPVLLAVLTDDGGINTSGSGLGHDLSGYSDGNRNNPVVLNSYFENELDNYRKGSLKYNLAGLSEGNHSFTLKAWDNYNNSSEKTIHFVVSAQNKFILGNLFNYPNPFTSSTTFRGEINKPGEQLIVKLDIFNLSGTLVRSINTVMNPAGYALEPIIWDGNDGNGNRLARGMYIYSVSAETANGETAKSTGRLIIM